MADKVKENDNSVETVGVLNKELLKNPEVLAALQHRCGPIPSAYAASLPKVVKRRLKALKKLQVETNEIEAKFYEELHKLECQYQLQFEPLFTKRSDIINAKVEPTDEESEWPDDENDPLSDKFDQLKIEGSSEPPSSPETLKLDENAKGIPEFWLTLLKNVDMLREMIQPHDEPILKHLQDIRVTLESETGFTLEFCFEPNEYFANTVLTKKYFLRFQLDKSAPLMFEGPEVYKSTGTVIEWNAGKNVTVRLVKKVQKHKGRGTKRVVTKTIQNDSFFNFFDPPQVNEDDKEVDEDTEALLDADFEIGQFFRERIVPRAVLYFTGEALDDDDEEYDEYEEGDDDAEDEHDDDEEEDDN